MFMPEGEELEIAEEEREAREKGIEKMIRFQSVSTLMDQRRITAIERRIQESRQQIRQIIYTPEEIEQQKAIQAVTDLAFPE